MLYNVIMDNPLITDNLNLVHKVLHDLGYHQERQDYSDYYQVGCLALTRAANNFDSNNGTKFSTYAYTAIRNEIHSWYYDDHLIRMKSQKKREQSFVEIEEWIPMPTDELSGLDRLTDYDVKRLNKIKHAYGDDDTFRLALDLFDNMHWSDEDVKRLQYKYKNYTGSCATALKQGKIKQIKSYLAMVVRKKLGVRIL